MRKVLLASVFATVSTIASAEALIINVTFGDEVHALRVAQVCSKSAVSKNGYRLPVHAAEDGTLMVGTQHFAQYICAKRVGGGGGNTTIKESGRHTGQSAEEVAKDLGLPDGSVETIDPGPVVDHAGVVDTSGDGDSNDEADAVTAEGATQEDTQPDEGTPGDTTNSGNDGVDIF